MWGDVGTERTCLMKFYEYIIILHFLTLSNIEVTIWYYLNKRDEYVDRTTTKKEVIANNKIKACTAFNRGQADRQKLITSKRVP